MPGGGVFELAPGQITDDGELTLCLAHALSNGTSFSIEKIARSYAKWIESNPFDIGNTTRYSLGCFLDPEWKRICDAEGYSAGMSRAAVADCIDSKANGSLMRSTPLGIWGYKLDPYDLALLAMQDSALSHPNKSCCQAVACYVIAISQLIRNQDRVAAFEIASEWAQSNANDEVCEWLDDAESNRRVPYQPQDGFVRIGFTHAFRHLLLGSGFLEALRETLQGGGDTDTNACIVGGLLGAVCGAESISDGLKLSVLNCNTRLGRYPRPEFLQSSQIPALVRSML